MYNRKLSDVGFPLRLPSLFPENKFSRVRFRHVSRICISKILPDFVYSPTFVCFAAGRGFGSFPELAAQRKDAHALRFARHMYGRRAAASTAGSSILRATFFHNGHSCANPIPNINRKNELRREKREKERKEEGAMWKVLPFDVREVQDVLALKHRSANFEMTVLYERQVLTTWRNSTTSRRSS